jgi:hypothetical protein
MSAMAGSPTESSQTNRVILTQLAGFFFKEFNGVTVFMQKTPNCVLMPFCRRVQRGGLKAPQIKNTSPRKPSTGLRLGWGVCPMAHRE